MSLRLKLRSLTNRSLQRDLDDELLQMFDALGRQVGDFIKRTRAEEVGDPHRIGQQLPAKRRSALPALAQVSMNLTDYEVTPPHVVFQAIQREAARYGVNVAGSEIIGLIPRRALEMANEVDLQIDLQFVRFGGGRHGDLDSSRADTPQQFRNGGEWTDQGKIGRFE